MALNVSLHAYQSDSGYLKHILIRDPIHFIIIERAFGFELDVATSSAGLHSELEFGIPEHLFKSWISVMLLV